MKRLSAASCSSETARPVVVVLVIPRVQPQFVLLPATEDLILGGLAGADWRKGHHTLADDPSSSHCHLRWREDVVLAELGGLVVGQLLPVPGGGGRWENGRCGSPRGPKNSGWGVVGGSPT
jgi:hypothetical protein